MTEQKNWHVYGAYSEEYEAFVTMVVGGTDKTADDLTTDGVTTFREFEIPLGDERLKYLTTFDHEPSAFEKDQVQPEEYREYGPDGRFLEPTIVLSQEGVGGSQVTTHHPVADAAASMIRDEEY